ncbi:MAG: EAL domain-containing response regulator [Goleter apudmare HA4340-LM2]|jgi:EAL domain-containing protein (putative c-di-GMP-specific phosphodiesterase class I)/CheY-like chemotaxis protein|nr:EAL domain-containing response regulator [Goleter apudmare HA4340-LM2]
MTKILVIEDEESVRENLLDLLDAEDFDTIAAANGKIGVNLACSEFPDLILCDVMMPEIDGYGVLSTLRQDPTTATIPFIFLTAKSAKFDFRQGMDMGADDYLTKPFTRAELLSAIVNRLEKQANLKKYLLSTQTALQTLSPKMQLLEMNLSQVIQEENFQEFELSYQPIISVASGKIIAAESLLRWQSPELGLVSAGEFLPLAESTGLIIPLDNWLLKSVCEQINRWQNHLGMFSLSIAVNVSHTLLIQANFIPQIIKILENYNLAPQDIEIELNESAIMQDFNSVISTMNQLQSLGVSIAINEFGLGYSSVISLKELPINTLKIGRYFIHNVTVNQEKSEITKSLIKMAHNLHLQVIAEGVATEAELSFLREHNCDAVQGSLLSHPLPAAELENFF